MKQKFPTLLETKSDKHSGRWYCLAFEESSLRTHTFTDRCCVPQNLWQHSSEGLVNRCNNSEKMGLADEIAYWKSAWFRII